MESMKRKKVSYLKNHRVEILINNFVDKDVQSMLRPLNLMQTLQFCPKYCIKNNFITPNSRLSNLVSVCGTILFISIFIYDLLDILYVKRSIPISKYIPLMGNVNFVFYCLGFLMNLTLSILYTEESVLYALKFQEIHRFLNNKTSFKLSIIGNWFAVIVLLLSYICFGTFFYILTKTPVHYIFTTIILLSFDGNIVYAIRLIEMLKDKVDLWNIQALQYQSTEDRESQDYCKRMFQAYVNILDCFDIYKVSFKVKIFYHITVFFYQYHIQILIIIDFFKFSECGNFYFCLCVIATMFACCVVKFFTICIVLVLRYEKFYTAMTNVQDSCALILNSNCTDAEKRLCKNIKRLHRARFDKLDACRMFYVDATFPLKFIALLTNNTFVLLQFAFL